MLVEVVRGRVDERVKEGNTSGQVLVELAHESIRGFPL